MDGDGSLGCVVVGVDFFKAAGLALGEVLFSPAPFSKAAIAAAIPRLAGPFGPIEEGFGAGDALSVFGEGSGLSGVGWRSGTVGGWVGGLMLSLLIGVASMG